MATETRAPEQSFPITDSPRVLGWTRQQTYRLLKDGRLESFLVGRRRYITMDSAQRLIAEELQNERERLARAGRDVR